MGRYRQNMVHHLGSVRLFGHAQRTREHRIRGRIARRRIERSAQSRHGLGGRGGRQCHPRTHRAHLEPHSIAGWIHGEIRNCQSSGQRSFRTDARCRVRCRYRYDLHVFQRWYRKNTLAHGWEVHIDVGVSGGRSTHVPLLVSRGRLEDEGGGGGSRGRQRGRLGCVLEWYQSRSAGHCSSRMRMEGGPPPQFTINLGVHHGVQ
mmetsp:Transcript_18372/g.38552  ORF Transcript_18372/g.38552 Transcript_18372/m.38552 type:complete len:204 (+) Transcript_18372:229-840(+)